MGTATEVTVQWQINRTRGARVLKRFMAAEHYDSFVSPVAFYHLFPRVGALLALKLTRKLSVHAVCLCSSCANHVPHFAAQALRAEAAAYATLARWSTRITYAKRACSCLVLALCLSFPPLYCPGAMRLRQACGRLTTVFGLLDIVAGWTW
jgi:hypothetical protein